MARWRTWIDTVIDGWFPIACAYCARQIAREGLCDACESAARELLVPEVFCDFDGMAVFVACRYDGLVQDLVQRLKYGKDMHAGTGLVHVMRMAWPTSRFHPPDLIVPMPLSFLRRTTRGFNQAEVLAKPLAEWLHVPCSGAGLARQHRPRQAGLGRDRRLVNVTGSFHCHRTVPPRVLLVDDVVTTGSTLLAARHALLAAGATSVTAAVLAKARD